MTQGHPADHYIVPALTQTWVGTRPGRQLFHSCSYFWGYNEAAQPLQV